MIAEFANEMQKNLSQQSAGTPKNRRFEMVIKKHVLVRTVRLCERQYFFATRLKPPANTNPVIQPQPLIE